MKTWIGQKKLHLYSVKREKTIRALNLTFKARGKLSLKISLPVNSWRLSDLCWQYNGRSSASHEIKLYTFLYYNIHILIVCIPYRWNRFLHFVAQDCVYQRCKFVNFQTALGCRSGRNRWFIRRLTGIHGQRDGRWFFFGIVSR